MASTPGMSPLDDAATSPALSDAQLDAEARDAALVFMCQLLRGYARFLVEPGADYATNAEASLFDTDGFVKHACDPAKAEGGEAHAPSASLVAGCAPFMRWLCATQAFAQLAQRRTEGCEPALLMFDGLLEHYHAPGPRRRAQLRARRDEGAQHGAATRDPRGRRPVGRRARRRAARDAARAGRGARRSSGRARDGRARSSSRARAAPTCRRRPQPHLAARDVPARPRRRDGRASR